MESSADTRHFEGRSPRGTHPVPVHPESEGSDAVWSEIVDNLRTYMQDHPELYRLLAR